MQNPPDYLENTTAVFCTKRVPSACRRFGGLAEVGSERVYKVASEKASSAISSHSNSEISSFTSISAFGTSSYYLTAMAKDNGKCGDCDCAAGTCAKENGGKCGNCDCPAGTCANENGGKCGDCDCAAGTCAKE